MSKRVNEFVETQKALRESECARAKKREEAAIKEQQARQEFENNYHNIREAREYKMRRHSRLLEEARNSALSTVLKGIYITALEAHTLTDNGIIIAESMVDNYIKERGGATKILNSCKENTYLLSRITSIVEDAAEDEVKEIEKDPDEEDEKEDKKKSESSEEKKEEKDSKDEGKEEKPEEKESEDEKEEKSDDKESKEDDKKEEKDSSPIDMSTDFLDDDDDEEIESVDKDGDPSNDDTEAAEEIIDDIEEDQEEEDDDEESAGPIFDELKKEDDIKKAIDLIKKRVSDAEEAFIKRNKEDKEQINALLNKISGNVKTVEDIADKDDTESKLAQESARMTKQKIDQIRDGKPMKVFDKMARKVSSNIVKDVDIREHYVLESGQLDVPMVMETAKVMYAFLETINTLQLEKVDEKYIQEVLEKM